MDISFNRPRKKPTNPTSTDKNPKALPSFRGSSELPENAEAESTIDSSADIITASGDNNIEQIAFDPTDLTLDREKVAIEEREIKEQAGKEKKMKFIVKGNNKKHILVLLILLFMVAAGALALIFIPNYLDSKNQQAGNIVDVEVNKEQKPALQASLLTGVLVEPELAGRPVTAIMIENGLSARPQTGIAEADLVFEAIAEGGITRFISLYQESQPANIGPIRSARPYYVDIARTFDAAFVHAGGSPDSLARIGQIGVKGMSAFEQNGTYYRSADRSAPHNLYSSMSRIDSRRTELGLNTSEFSPWKRKSDTPQSATANTIEISISSFAFNPVFYYDATSNSYLRAINGEADFDETTGQRVSPKVVIALALTRAQSGIYSDYQLTSGEMLVFQDGIVSSGTWTKDGPAGQFVFKDKNGLDFAFNRGRTWVSFVESTTRATYTE